MILLHFIILLNLRLVVPDCLLVRKKNDSESGHHLSESRFASFVLNSAIVTSSSRYFLEPLFD